MRCCRSLKPPGLGYLGDEHRERQKQMLKDRTAEMGFGSGRRVPPE
jgi:hypothetical protein